MAILNVFGNSNDQNSRNRARGAKDSNSKKVVVSVGRPQTTVQDNRTQFREIIQDARDEAYRIKKAAEEEARKIRQESLEIEKRIALKEEALDTKIARTQKQETLFQELRANLSKKEDEIVKLRDELIAKLEKVTSLTSDEAKKIILENVEKELNNEIAKRIKEAEEKIKATSDEIAKEILVNSMIAGATNWAAEYTVSIVKLESEDIKGRIIGKEGRNIRAFELATGVDVELDSDVPNEVRLSSFDPVRREIARTALESLVKDARIQPTKIEQLVEKAKEMISRDMSEAGRRAANELGLYSLPQEALDTLGRLKFRYSYGQNQLIASLEAAKIAGKIADEIDADAIIARTGALFHDIGKTQVDKEGTHVRLGVELAKKWGFPQEIINCIAQHHEDEPFSSVESIVVHLADAVSGARPGARHEPVEEYMKRLAGIEKVAASFQGVDRVYAIQAGREIRVIVKPDIIDDAGIITLARDVKTKLEQEITFPGQITVTVIRETRAVDIAK